MLNSGNSGSAEDGAAGSGEGGQPATQFWAQVDNMEGMQEMELLPQEIAEIIGGNDIVLPKHFNYEDDDEPVPAAIVSPPAPEHKPEPALVPPVGEADEESLPVEVDDADALAESND